MRIELNSKEIAQALCEYVERIGYLVGDGDVQAEVVPLASEPNDNRLTIRARVEVLGQSDKTGKAQAK